MYSVFPLSLKASFLEDIARVTQTCSRTCPDRAMTKFPTGPRRSRNRTPSLSATSHKLDKNFQKTHCPFRAEQGRSLPQGIHYLGRWVDKTIRDYRSQDIPSSTLLDPPVLSHWTPDPDG